MAATEKVNQAVNIARRAVLDQALHCKKVAWQRHHYLDVTFPSDAFFR